MIIIIGLMIIVNICMVGLFDHLIDDMIILFDHLIDEMIILLYLGYKLSKVMNLPFVLILIW